MIHGFQNRVFSCYTNGGDIMNIVILSLFIINFIAVVLLLFFEHKNPTVTLAWLLVLTFMPVIGLILYFMLGSRYKIKLMTRKYSLKKVEEEHQKMYEKLQHQEIPKEFMKYEDMILLNEKNSSSIFTIENDYKLYIDAKEKFEDLLEDIKNAKKTIHISYFIFKTKDQIGKELVELLTEKAKEGVRVKLIYDRLGCLKTRYQDFQELIDAGGEVLPFLPSVFRTWFHFNYRYHRKIVVIDGKIAYTGGINVGDDYLSKYERIKPWRDSAIRLIGESVILMQLRFLCDWYYLYMQDQTNSKPFFVEDIFDKKVKPLPVSKKMGIQILSSGPDSEPYIKESYIKMIMSAKKYIYIETPYFVPDETFLTVLRMACLSGIDVRMVLPKKPDKPYVYAITLSYAEDLLKAGAKIYLREGFIHAKSIVIDDFVTNIGSCNIDIRSFVLDYELNAVIYQKEAALENKKVFMEDIEKSEELTLEDLKNRSIFERALQKLLRLFAPLS